MDGDERRGWFRTFVLGSVVGASAALAANSAAAASSADAAVRAGSPRSRARPAISSSSTQSASSLRSRTAASLSAHVPIYEYRCPNGHTFEVFQKMTDPVPEGVCDVRRGAGREDPLPRRRALQGLGVLLDRLRSRRRRKPKRTATRAAAGRQRRRSDEAGRARLARGPSKKTRTPSALATACGVDQRRVQPAP